MEGQVRQLREQILKLASERGRLINDLEAALDGWECATDHAKVTVPSEIAVLRSRWFKGNTSTNG